MPTIRSIEILPIAICRDLGSVCQHGIVRLEFPCDPTGPHLYVDDVVKEPIGYEAGHLVVPRGPGLGIEVDEAKLRELSARFPEPAVRPAV